ncbi:hypothetical protein PE066_10985 [Ramlibacter tataouinensis]|uniref:glycine zipper 2TM domain-containing protein n=1 Tax=Ramlibacter tataouinensis TaxID=94132 RepID=UPI0022F3DCF1|nr:glycine zipper 2TM domain-containing protein [Ramlibacter tataouinensis]WBY00008.1 hypothetical protein PE066_10985 [Ramlibacter tataouinensis]
MKIRTVTLLAACTLLGACAHRPAPVNYGHPALNAAAAPAPRLQNDPGRVALGTVIGGLAGAQVGGGSGRLAAAGAGAAIGAMAAQGDYSHEAALGGLAGGLIGSQVGGGSGRLAATAAGAGLGAWLAVPRN